MLIWGDDKALETVRGSHFVFGSRVSPSGSHVSSSILPLSSFLETATQDERHGVTVTGIIS